MAWENRGSMTLIDLSSTKVFNPFLMTGRLKQQEIAITVVPACVQGHLASLCWEGNSSWSCQLYYIDVYLFFFFKFLQGAHFIAHGSFPWPHNNPVK